MRISIDIDRCVGAGQCVLSAPDVFDQNDDGLVMVLATEPADSDGKAVQQAREICPSQAITLH